MIVIFNTLQEKKIMEKEYSVTFKGFKTKKQARLFASWYEGSGEQTFDYTGLEADEPFTAYTDAKQGFYKQLQDGNVEVYLNVEMKE
jgi:hypothetical protein